MASQRPHRAAWGLAALGLLAACGEEAAAVPFFPDSYSGSYILVRDCRVSVEHDLRNIVVWASPGAEGAYRDRVYPFAQGSVVLKEEFSDSACGDLLGFTVMRKEAPGYDPAHGDWRWQRVSLARAVVEDGRLPRCASCHAGCKDGDYTCAVP